MGKSYSADLGEQIVDRIASGQSRLVSIASFWDKSQLRCEAGYRLIFIDETATTTKMTKLRGRAP
ncbi:hypothetical protein [Sphingobium sp. AP50]|uniref:hypothetical protein n=1 Tax=Sphingobium sp. AP50 TaxID=1884369 RepID=UPI000B83C159|nr:hypothetical protein [Sphingobium sp. AP50]